MLYQNGMLQQDYHYDLYISFKGDEKPLKLSEPKMIILINVFLSKPIVSTTYCLHFYDFENFRRKKLRDIDILRDANEIYSLIRFLYSVKCTYISPFNFSFNFSLDHIIDSCINIYMVVPGQKTWFIWTFNIVFTRTI